MILRVVITDFLFFPEKQKQENMGEIYFKEKFSEKSVLASSRNFTWSQKFEMYCKKKENREIRTYKMRTTSSWDLLWPASTFITNATVIQHVKFEIYLNQYFCFLFVLTMRLNYKYISKEQMRFYKQKVWTRKLIFEQNKRLNKG